MEDLKKNIKSEFEKIRPPEKIRDQLDFSYTFENYVFILNEVRPRWDDKSKISILPIIKAKFVLSRKVWKLYWMRADMKWHVYSPNPEVKYVKKLFQIINQDKFGCFFG